ncbi:methyltransferase domain-containing protein [Luteimonas sp. A277]
MNPMEQARGLFEQAIEHHRNHRLQAAEQLYRQALVLVPDRVSLLVNLSAVLIGQGRTDEASALSQQALAIEPGHPDALEHLAACSQAKLDPEERLRRIEADLLRQPQDAGLHNQRGLLLHDMARPEEACASFSQALALDPDNPGTLSNRAMSLEALAQHERALEDYRQAVRASPDYDQAGYGLINTALAIGYLPTTPDPGFEELLARALERPWARPQSIAPLAQAWLKRSPDMARVLTDLDGLAAGPGISDTRVAEASRVLAHNRLLVALLQHAVVTDIELERLLTRLRAAFLAETMRPDPPNGEPALAAFHCALAMQCFLNEYVYANDAREQAGFRDLAARLGNALSRRQPVPVRWITAVASYMPLHQVPGYEYLLEQPGIAAAGPVIRQQVAAPLQERQLAAAIPAITPIRDTVSVQVREQYEQNPYPRWNNLPRHTTRMGLRTFLKSRVAGTLPARLPGADGKPVEALNAGCGTGQHPIDMVQRIESIKLLAVDLSLASLAYAKRMAGEMQLQNIEFAQADILELGSIDRRFDLIESTGVLHHLADPAQGLAVLCRLLRDDGVMRLALYSEHARQSVAACRRYIAERGYRSTPEDIRRCRAELMSLEPGDPRREAMKFTDFYSMSECRDLLFHVQEHRFNLPDLRILLQRMSLDFLGFELQPGDLDGFRRRFPDPADRSDLLAWDAHERQNPDLFAGMYVFWVRKSAAGISS